MTKTLSRVVSDSNRRMICEFAMVRVVSSLARRVPPRIVDEFPKRVFCCLPRNLGAGFTEPTAPNINNAKSRFLCWL